MIVKQVVLLPAITWSSRLDGIIKSSSSPFIDLLKIVIFHNDVS